MSAGIALARQPSSPRRLPTIERDRDADFINCIPLTHSGRGQEVAQTPVEPDRKSTRLNSSHGYISYAVFCLKKKKNTLDILRCHSRESSTVIDASATRGST